MLQELENEQQAKKKKRKSDAAIAKIKKSKEYQRRKRGLEGEPGGDDDDELAWDMYVKRKPLPGQLENCEICEKRFTVTPYSKEGPDGGLCCPKCSKEVEESKKKDAKQKKTAVSRDKRRKLQSDLLDGHVTLGGKTLQELCVEVRPNRTCSWYYKDCADRARRKLQTTSRTLRSSETFLRTS